MTAHEPHAEEAFNPHRVKTLVSWHAPGRPFKRRGKEFFANVLLITLAVEIILFLFAQYFFMMAVVALVFVSFVLVTVEPHNFYYKVSTEGIMVEDHFFLWQELYDFHFKRTDDVDVLHIGTKSFFPGELVLVLGDISKGHIKDVLLPYLPYREFVKPTFQEKAADWLVRTFPMENTPRHK